MRVTNCLHKELKIRLVLNGQLLLEHLRLKISGFVIFFKEEMLQSNIWREPNEYFLVF